MTAGTKWTKAEEAMVIRMTRSGFGLGFIARSLGRGRSAVAMRRTALGCAVGNTWPAAKVELFRAMYAAGMGRRELSKHFGISANAASTRLSRMRLTKPSKFSEETIEQITTMIEIGVGRGTVAAKLGIPTSVVEYYSRTFGLVNRNSRAEIDPYHVEVNERIRSLSMQGVCNADIGRLSAYRRPVSLAG